jgi:hypothetical protein
VTSAFAERRSDLSELRGQVDIELGGSTQIVASVIGLAPIRGGLKIRLLELLCIHGRGELHVTGYKLQVLQFIRQEKPATCNHFSVDACASCR